MVLSEAERDKKIEEFLSRKFKQHNIQSSDSTSLEARLIGSMREI